jgi:hypothetical protein
MLPAHRLSRSTRAYCLGDSLIAFASLAKLSYRHFRDEAHFAVNLIRRGQKRPHSIIEICHALNRISRILLEVVPTPRAVADGNRADRIKVFLRVEDDGGFGRRVGAPRFLLSSSKLHLVARMQCALPGTRLLVAENALAQL